MDQRIVVQLDHYLAGPEWNEGLIHKNIRIMVQKNPQNGSFFEAIRVLFKAVTAIFKVVKAF